MELGKCEITFQRISQQFKRSGLGWGAFLETKVKVTEPRWRKNAPRWIGWFTKEKQLNFSQFLRSMRFRMVSQWIVSGVISFNLQQQLCQNQILPSDHSFTILHVEWAAHGKPIFVKLLWNPIFLRLLVVTLKNNVNETSFVRSLHMFFYSIWMVMDSGFKRLVCDLTHVLRPQCGNTSFGIRWRHNFKSMLIIYKRLYLENRSCYMQDLCTLWKTLDIFLKLTQSVWSLLLFKN